MEKEYNHEPENPESGKISEPAIVYGKEQVVTVPCQYTIQELRENFDRAVKQAEAGEVLSHEEVKNRYKKL